MPSIDSSIAGSCKTVRLLPPRVVTIHIQSQPEALVNSRVQNSAQGNFN